MLSPAETRAYLDRIGYDGPRAPTLETLRSLHRAHVFAVPFENLDIHLGRHIPVDVGWAYRKIVEHRRGGYCYELNPLFHALLTHLGFDATIISGRVLLRDEGHPFDHVSVIVHLEEDWLADVGYGRPPPLLPIGRAGGIGGVDGSGMFSIERRGDEHVVVDARDDGGRDDLLGFHLTARILDEFDERSRWIQTSPDSIFTRTPLCSLPFEGGRATLSGLNWIRSAGAEVEVEKISAKKRTELLRDVFGIDLGGARLPDGEDLEFIPGRKVLDS